MLSHFSFPIFQPGAPTTVLLRDVSAQVTRYQHTISAQGWYETATVELACRREEARWWCDQLYASTIIYDDLPSPIWEGYLNQVQATIDGTTWTVSLDAAASRVRVRYTTTLGTPGTSDLQTDTTQTYGTKDLVLTNDAAKSKTVANTMAANELARRKTPLATRSVNAGGSTQPGVSVQLSFKGWYTTLEWVLTSRSDTTTEQTSDQLATLLGNSGQGFGGTRSGITLDTTQIAASGVSSSRQIAPDTSFRAAIEQRLSLGQASGTPYVYGVGRNRTFFARGAALYRTWDTMDTDRRYVYRQDGNTILDLRGAVVPPWRILPDTVLLGVATNTPPSAKDRSGRTYLNRVSCEVTPDGASATLEPAANDSAAARLGALS